ncbi:ketopantoate reductase PanE/ApbA C terminal-domain-containing protein [Pseudomassariella vexata]|uniref:Ketopantoate reductase PanE/ApbA C terminal-domain-containing protein n=1 Tax=Pseudomassariella vexata TaxID=1141098 RepID=A0A1Y2EA23_9PEZI|nr:ketopantoate reductase PanE/ApbA C terminal-domain-containing protein [Pseudomassariella vexata]ORY68421.1 ketopantoate reductase PanE/ApbA C terminal-domain-containing protein [Pseudomassariella vexata]
MWLQSVLDDTTQPPRLYAWTPENLNSMKPESRRSSPSRLSDPARRIYILGLGNLGRLFASGLVQHHSKPPITLVVHRRELLEHWVSSPAIEITRKGSCLSTVKFADFDVEWWTSEKPVSGPLSEPASGKAINNLIIATKASDALPQVDKLRKYLDSNSTVAFTQNGMCKLWPPLGNAYIHHRFPHDGGPNFIACVTTHGVLSLGPFKSMHASMADVSVGPVLRNPQTGRGPEYLMDLISEAPDLDGRQVPTPQLWILQLEKLVVNSIINPLTAILRCKNGKLFERKGDNVSLVIDALVQEASNVLVDLIRDSSSAQVIGDMDQAVIDELVERFSFPRLQKMVLNVGEKVKHNTSSMLQDVLAGKQTEVRHFNGWIVETANYLNRGQDVSTHEKIISLVEGGKQMWRRELVQSVLSI